MRSTQRLPHLFLVLLVLSAFNARGQYFRNSDYWKTHRSELSFGLGVSNFLGELGGRDRIGSPFVYDLEFSQTKPTLSLGMRYFVAEHAAVRGALTYGVLAGNDNLTKETFRHNRNLSFKSNVFEAQVVFEFHPFLESLGHVYDLRGVQGQKSSRIGLYVFAGVGGFYFNPTTQLNGQWVELRPLGTEGQGLPDGPKPYSNYGFCIPMGVGLRKAVSKQISIGLELQYTKTFTDYIDDVSGTYYDNNAIRAAHGAQAAYLADPNLGEVAGQTFEGQQRGDSTDKDAYLFVKFQVHYKLYKFRSANKKYRTRIRRQKIVF